ncbi:MAG TPA: RDD family protein [Steroidobacteraceae bacterium]|nr:RDD family protein [Steroidobacteraceae bacterium]
MERAILDTAVVAETPEGIAIELHPAGISPRVYAYLLDSVIRFIAFSILLQFAVFMKGMGVALVFIFWFVMEWFYPVAFELSRWGATPGKRAFGIKVVMDSGLPITPAGSLTRNLLRTADFLPFFYGFAILCMLLRRDFKRLGDIAAATLVVYQAPPAKKVVIQDVPPVAPAYPLPPQDQAALIALAARASRLTVERVDELAALAAPICGAAGHSGPEVTRRVLGVAQWLLGKR